MKRILGFLSIIMLCGCMRVGVNETKDKKPVIEDGSKDKTPQVLMCTNSSEEVAFDAKGNQIQKMTHTFYMDYKDLGITDEMNEEEIIKAISESLEKLYEDIDGVDAKGQKEEKRVKVTISIDYEKADYDELVESGLIVEGEADSLYISLEKTEKDYEKNGFVCNLES